MSSTIKYKGNTIATINTDTAKTLKTSGKYCEGDIIVENVQDGIEPSKNTWNIVNPQVQAYLDWVSQNPYSASDYTTSYFDDWTPTYDSNPTGVDLTLPAGNLVVTDEGNNHTYQKTIAAGTNTIYNLIPYKAKYTVENNDNIVSIGELLPTGSRRFIKNLSLDGNMRDLGGLTCDGGTIKFGKIIRGGGIRANTNTERNEIARILHDEIGIRAELELRGIESGTYADTILGSDVDYCKPYVDNNYWCYYSTVLNHKAEIKESFRFIFDSVKQGKPLYFHCQQGADRTGTMAVLIEALLGVPQNQIDVDYELTSFQDIYSFRKRNGREYEEGKWEYGYRDFLTALNNLSVGSTLRDKVVNLIASLGFSADEINDFRKAMSSGTPETVIPSIATYTVTKTETNTAITGESSATQYQRYEAEITPSDGYVINDITVTMGGVDITSQVLSANKTNRFLSITKVLSNCSIDNNKNRVIYEQGYGATITANDNYTLEGATITITMGGVDVSTYYSNGKIAIPQVTGDIEITATAVPTASYTNLADPTSEEWKDGYRITSSAIAAQSGKTVSNPIDVAKGDVIRVKGVSFVNSVDRYQLQGTNANGDTYTDRQYVSSLPNYSLDYSLDGDVHTFTVISSSIISNGKLCFAFNTPTDSSTVIITRNEPIE